MQRVSFSKKGGIRPPVFSIVIILSFFIIQGLTAGARAQGVFSAGEQIYLKNITPLLYEFSQVASDVSVSVLRLQSAPPEECTSKFADYRGIVESLSGQLGSMTPPKRLETVQSYAMQALDGYSKGLGLYYNACTEKDYGVKESLVSQGGGYLNRSVDTVKKAYGEIENLKSAGPPVVKEETSEQITEGEITEGAAPADTGTETPEQKAAAPNPPVQQAKSKEQVLAEISKKVEAEMETKEAEESKHVKAERAEVKTPRQSERHNKVSAAETPEANTENAVSDKHATTAAKAPEPTMEPTPAPPQETASLKSEEEPSREESSAGNENGGTPAGKEEESKEPAKEESGKDKIQKLNQKIMEQANSNQGTNPAAESVPAKPGTDESKGQDENAGASATPESGNSKPAEPGNPSGANENKDVSLVPSGGTAENLKEEEVPVDDVKSWCIERYEVQTDRDDCMKKRAAAKDKMDKLSQSFKGGTKERDVLDKCMSDWKDGGTYNYELVISCTQFFCTQRGIENCKDLSK